MTRIGEELGVRRTSWWTTQLAVLAAVAALVTLVPLRADDEKAVEKPADEAHEADTAEAAQPAMQPNPLGRIFGKIFARPDNAPILPTPDPDREPRQDRRDRARDNIDLRAPQNDDQTSRLRRAESLIGEEKFDEGYEYLEALLGLRDSSVDPPEDSLVRTDSGQWISIQWEANRMLGELPGEILEAHRLAHGPEANARLEAAREHRDLGRLAEVATRFFQTEAGHDAANLLAALHFERGEYGLAARWYVRLLEARADVTADPTWQLKAVAALVRSAQPERAEEIAERLRDGNATSRLRIKGDPIEFDSWFAALEGERTSAHVPVLAEWHTPYGTSRRVAKQVGSEPLLVPRWTVTEAAVVDSSRRVGRQLEWLGEDLRDQRLPAIPSIQPISVDGRIVYRTLGGVVVVDASTGEQLWETDRGISPLVLLGAESTPGQNGLQTHVGGYSGQNADQHPLTNLLVRNGLWGTISTDGRRLFVIEDQPVMLHKQNQYNRFGGGGSGVDFKTIGDRTLNFSSNRLVAYDVRTGRPVWNVGGRRSIEPFAPPLEGMYFFGTPVAEGGELFAVGERDDEIRLVSIDPDTGLENWSQLIALPDVEIEDDTARRTFSAQVAIGDGVIVCPTSVGWLVAVDRLNHNVLWAQRYQPAPALGEVGDATIDEMSQTQTRQLGQRWSASAPIIVGNRVLYSPEEEAALYCFDLFDGHELWERPMQGHLFVGGVFGEHVLLVGRDAIEALDVAEGRRQWTIDVQAAAAPEGVVVHEARRTPPMPVPMGHGEDSHAHSHGHVHVTASPVGDARVLPSGRGVMIGDRYHLPMTTGELWSIDLGKGEIVNRAYLQDDALPLGNLLEYADGLYSVTAFGLRAFEPRTAFERAIAAAEGDRTAETRLKRAELHVLHHRYDDAAAALREMPLNEVPEALRDTYRRTLVRLLQEVVLAHPDSRGDIDELAALARTPAEQREFRRLRARRFEAIGEHEAAFRAYLALTDDVADEAAPVPSEGNVSVRATNWLAGRLLDTWLLLDEATRERTSGDVRERATRALAAGPDDRRRFADLFAFHPAVVEVERRYLADLAGEAAVGVVEARVRNRLLRNADPEVTAAAGTWLDDYLASHGVAVEETETIGPNWGDIDVELVQTRDYSSNQFSFPIDPRPGRAPFFRTHRMVVHQYQNHFGGGYMIRRLEIVNARDGSRYWMPTLRSEDYSTQNVSICRTAGNLAFLGYHNVLTVLSPVDRRIVWVERLGSQEELSTFFREPHEQLTEDVKMQFGPQMSAVANRAHRVGMFAVANREYVALHGRQRISVHDADTGEIRWEIEDVGANSQVYGNEELMIVVTEEGRATAHRPLDGKPLEEPDTIDLVRRALRFDEHGIVLTENRSSGGILGLGGVKTVVRRRDVATREDRWSTEFDRNTGFVLLFDDQLLAMSTKGELELLDLLSGERAPLGRVPEDVLQGRGQIYALADSDRVYVFVDGRGRPNVITDDSLPNVRFNGVALAYDRATGELLWQEKVEQQALLLPYFQDSPFVVFSSRQYQQNANRNFGGYYVTKAVLLDKRTGRRVFDGSIPTNNGFQSMHVDTARRFLELRSYNGRTIFHAVPRESTATKESSIHSGDGSTSDGRTDEETSTGEGSDVERAAPPTPAEREAAANAEQEAAARAAVAAQLAIKAAAVAADAERAKRDAIENQRHQ